MILRDPLSRSDPRRAVLVHLVLGALGTFFLAAINVSSLLGAPLAVAGAIAGIALAPVLSLSLLLVASHATELLVGASFGRLSVVDMLLVAILLRTAIEYTRGHGPGRLIDPRVGLGATVILAGGLATITATEGSAVTAYLRLATYIAVGMAAALRLTAAQRNRVLGTLIGVATGDTLGAIMHLTPRGPTELPVGRYLGTTGDPAQFGIPVAVALLLLVAFPALVPWRRVRWGLIAVLAVGLAGSGTRAAWGAFAAGMTVTIAYAMADHVVSWRKRFASGAGLGALLVAGAAAVTVAAPQLRLDATSTRVRIDSLHQAADYLAAHPFGPTGLGNVPGEFPAYNTWLALAIALSPLTALLFVGYVGMSLRAATRLAIPAMTVVLVAVLGASFTENLMFAGSSLTLTWLLLIGLALVAPQPSEESTAR